LNGVNLGIYHLPVLQIIVLNGHFVKICGIFLGALRYIQINKQGIQGDLSQSLVQIGAKYLPKKFFYYISRHITAV